MMAQYQKDFIKTLEAADGYRQSPSRVFSAFLDAAFATLNQANYIALYGERSPLFESDYEQGAKLLKGDTETLPKLFGLLTLALEEREYDFLGGISEELGTLEKNYRGQVFTPHELSSLCTRLVLGTAKDLEQYTSQNKLTIEEPAVGGGAMIITTASHLKEQGMTPNRWIVYCNDIDFRCVQMSFIQFTLLDIPAIVMYRDTLAEPTTSENKYEGYPTFAYLRHNANSKFYKVLGTPYKERRVCAA